MPASYEIKYMPEGRVERFWGSAGNYYEFADGSRLNVWTAPGWCRPCGCVVEAEEITTVEEIDRRIAELQDPTSTAYAIWEDDLIDEMFGGSADEGRQEFVNELTRRRRWREERVSPPRCLQCGSTDVLLFPLGQGCPNPAGPGTILVGCVGMCTTDFNEWFFTPEGERIPRLTKPTRWKHPDLENSSDELDAFLRSCIPKNKTRRKRRKPE